MTDANVKRSNDGQISGYAAMAPRQPVRAYQYTPKALGRGDVEVAISHCGICHTDLHLLDDNPPGLAVFPLVPGHEIVGVVSQRGSDVTHLEVGQRVGIGPLAGACFACEQCRSGREQLCAQAQYLPLHSPGGYASHVRVHSRCAFPLPDALASEDAAPLLCAGVTVFAPLVRHARPSQRVGVIGVGGLGHLALQYARAMGCDVTAFSSSSSKKAEALRFGANEFVSTEHAAAWTERAGLYDLILTTAAGDLPWSDYLNVLKPEGTLCVIGLPDHEVKIPAIPLIFGQRKVVGTLIGSTAENQAMLHFSARHRIKPQIEVSPMSDANAALDRLRRNEVRYRSVLTNQ